MSSTSKANFARKMAAGSYHQSIFREERNIHERIVMRGGKPVSSATSGPSLTLSFGDVLAKALKR